MSQTFYVMGTSDAETRRLTAQATLLRPITDRLLRAAGVGPGQRVLEIGCGAGDVCQLAAELVGPGGSVLGIDRDPEVLAVARQRARDAGLDTVRTQQATAADFQDTEGFDAVIGRYVLVHQEDQVGFLRDAARLTRPGGVIAFHEMNALQGAQSLPRVELWQQVADWIVSVMRAGAPQSDVGARFVGLFAAAELPQPSICCETPAGGADSAVLTIQTETLLGLLPQLVQAGALTEDEVDADTLQQRLHHAVAASNSQIQWPPQYCAWARL